MMLVVMRGAGTAETPLAWRFLNHPAGSAFNLAMVWPLTMLAEGQTDLK